MIGLEPTLPRGNWNLNPNRPFYQSYRECERVLKQKGFRAVPSFFKCSPIRHFSGVAITLPAPLARFFHLREQLSAALLRADLGVGRT